MKLIQKTNLNFLSILLLIVPIAGVVLFFSVNHFILDEIDEKLEMDKSRIVKSIESGAKPESLAPIYEVKILQGKHKENTVKKNALVYDPLEEENEPYRELSAVKTINGQSYSIKVRHSTIEMDDLIKAIIWTILSLFVVLFILLFLLNAQISKKLWKPFLHNLNQLQHFSLKKGNKLELQNSSITEFNQLNDSLLLMTKKMSQDYQTLKEFTENASHEIQTPLSIMALNLDEIVQEDLSEKTLEKVYSVYQAAQRLSKLNEKLLLLAKLDNQQYISGVSISINDILKNQLDDFQPFFENQKIEVTTEFDGEFQFQIDPVLANTLVANLLSNAVKYNVEKGNVAIRINSEGLQISNPTNQVVNCDLIFERFKKGANTVNSTGLGLSIVKKIVELNQLEISANLENGVFQIDLKK